jgi:hypothetical protein
MAAHATKAQQQCFLGGPCQEVISGTRKILRKVLRTIGIFPRRTPFAICIWFSNFRTYMIILKNYAGNKQNSYKIMKMQMFETLDKANPDTGNTYKRLKLGGGQTYDLSSD